MDDREAPGRAVPPEATACFALIIQGVTPWAGVVQGVEGVKDALLRVLWRDPGHAVLEEVAALLASLDEPAAWAVHGAGDGQPFWHWWHGYDGGSVTVQRLTVALPPDLAADRLRATLGEVTGALTDCAEDLRKLMGTARGAYVFTRRHPG